MVASLQPDKWYLFEIRKLAKRDDAKSVDVLLECCRGDATGNRIAEPFYLSAKAISRFEVLAHRAGVEVEIKTPEQVDVKVFAQMLGKKVWAEVSRSDLFGGVLCTKGWNFRPESEPPEEENAIDYSMEEQWERAFE